MSRLTIAAIVGLLLSGMPALAQIPGSPGQLPGTLPPAPPVAAPPPLYVPPAVPPANPLPPPLSSGYGTPPGISSGPVLSGAPSIVRVPGTHRARKKHPKKRRWRGSAYDGLQVLQLVRTV